MKKLIKKIANKIETIFDDDEGVTSFCVWWGNVGSYLSIDYEKEDAKIYCEYGDQSNGFYPTYLRYEINNNVINFILEGTEFFSKKEKNQKISIEIPNSSDLEKTKKILPILLKC
jgi:hypothetical protein